MATIVALVITGAAAPAAHAVRDWDGDGAVPPADCSPLDPAVNPSAPDRPDLAFEDRNCDGIDGDPSKAIFVTLGGNDAAPGTLTNPVRTVQRAVNLASAQEKDVYVAGGTFLETVSVADDIGIYGGYEPITGKRSADQVTTLRGAPAILAVGDGSVRLQLLTLEGSADGAGNAYAVRAVASGSTPSRLALERVTARGLTAASGSSGTNGGTGTNFAGFGGGGGGAGGCGLGVLGNVGATGGGGGVGGPPGGTGSTPSPAPSGQNNTFQIVDNQASWPRPVANLGVQGAAGGGGGGGRGGAGATHPLQGPVCGGTGGTGGAGGGGGIRGTGGQNGGGSFGAYMFNSSVVAINSSFGGGTGGAGGNGGSGGFGGAGATGSIGAPGNCLTLLVVVCADSGFQAGRGGQGGRGGGGGGGAGGPSIGVFQAGAGSGYVGKGSTTQQGGPVALGGFQGNAGGRAGSGQSAGLTRTPTAPAVSTADFDGDGLNDTADQCPADPQGAGGAGGCPARAAKLADRDGDGVPDAKDACPNDRVSGADANEDGCTDAAPAPAPPPPPPPAPAPPVVIVQPSQTQQINVTLAFNYSASRTSTRLRTLQVRGVPGGATVTAKCKGKGCPKVKRKVASFTKRNAFDRVTLKPWVRKRLRVGTTITVTVTRAGMHGQVKKLVVQRRKAPRVTTTCIADGSKRKIPCAS